VDLELNEISGAVVNSTICARTKLWPGQRKLGPAGTDHWGLGLFTLGCIGWWLRIF
jgi:hypothetical protein